MGFIRYLGSWLRLALRHSLGRAEITTFAVFIVFGVLSWLSRYVPKGKTYPAPMEFAMQLAEGQIAAGVFTAVVLVRLMLAPYWMDKDKVRQIAELNSEKENLERERNGLPNIGSKNGVVVLAPALFIEIVENEFGLTGDSGFPGLNSGETVARWIRLGVRLEGKVFVETLELVISGKEPILRRSGKEDSPVYELKPEEVAYYHYFLIPDWVKHGDQRTVQVIAFADGVTWGSREISINFPPS